MSFTAKIADIMFTDRCDIYEYESTLREDLSTGAMLRLKYENLACRMSFDNIKRVYQTSAVGHTMQTVRLFLLPGVNVKPGSVITVTRNGEKFKYKNSGIPAVYETHTELLLEPDKTGA